MDMSKYRDMFFSETREHLAQMNQLLIALEGNPTNREAIDALFRHAHSIKGMAGSMEFLQTQELAHHLEELIDEFRKSGTATTAAIDRLLAGSDMLENLLQDIGADQPERDITAFLEETCNLGLADTASRHDADSGLDMGKFLQIFLSDGREHLHAMSQLFLNLEENQHSEEIIRELFRHAHSIKGMAASMGFQQTADLAHYMEDQIDRYRQGTAPQEGELDRLLAGVDLLTGLLDDIDEGRPERNIGPFVNYQPQRPTPKPAPVEPLPDSALVAEPAPRLEPMAAEPPAEEKAGNDSDSESNGDILDISVTLSSEAVAPAARTMLILKDLGVLGRILSSKPTREQIATGGATRHLDVRLETKIAPNFVQERLEEMSDIAEVRVERSQEKTSRFMRRRDDLQRTVRVRTELLDQFINLTGELITNRNMLQSAWKDERWEDLQVGLDRLYRHISNLHHDVLQLRMMPLASITGPLPRIIRDLARKQDKTIALEMEGTEVELDRAILEELSDPLMHMVRNAVDHGIAKAGTIKIRAWREKDLVLIEIQDDGRGIDPAALRRKAVDKGLLTESQARALPERDVLQLICHPGFSTAVQVTELSGRGVGMDVVKSAVENLGGSLVIRSTLGQGTSFLLKLPLSIAIIKVLLVECAGHQLGIPLTRVQRALDVSRKDINTSGKQLVLTYADEILPLVSLRKALQLPAAAPQDTVPVVITEARGRRIALVVDRLVGQKETFVKSLEFPINRLPGISGATVMGDGNIIFIIDPPAILEERRGQAGRTAAGVQHEPA